jgi:hypothetical protein
MVLQEIVKQAMLWVMAGAKALGGEVWVSYWIWLFTSAKGAYVLKTLTHVVESACNWIVCSVIIY